MTTINKIKRRLIAAGITILIILTVGYMLFIHDSGLNFYKKLEIKGLAKEYISKNYPDFKLSDVEVRYDKALNYYVVDCLSENDTITLNYNIDLFMEFDCYYNEKYTSEAVKYNTMMEKKFSEALKAENIECDNIAVYVDLNAIDKNHIVYEDAAIKNERIECIITYIRDKSEPVLDKYELAELSRDAAKCIYSQIDADTKISTLKIKYDYDETKIASIFWSHRMDDMSLVEIAEEIKY